MEELYRIIEQKIKDAGYPRAISGEMVYGDICDQIEGKENGSYVLLSKVEDDVIFEYHITVMDDEFNLGLLCKLCLNGMPVPLLRNCYSIFNGTKYR